MTKRSRKSTGIIAKETATPPIVDRRLLEDIRGLIESAKSRFAQTADTALTDLPSRRLHEAIRVAREQIAVRGGDEVRLSIEGTKIEDSIDIS